MTQLKKLKKTIRARAAKTGESYTAARRQVLKARQPRAAQPPALPPTPTRAVAPPARRPGLSEAGVVKKTGHGLAHWFAVLDAFGAAAQGHTASARHLHEAHGVPGWHCQMIAVAYERERGLRGHNQACTGDFQVSVSRAMAAPVGKVAAAFAERARRARWLAAADGELGRALEAALGGPKPAQVKQRDETSARLRYRWGKSVVEIRMTAKRGGGTTVVADNTKLLDPGEVEARRAVWKAALDGLKAHLAG